MNQLRLEKLGLALIAATALTALLVMLSLEPIPQDVRYHLFADTRSIGAIPNFWNVVTNIPFTIIGLLGLIQLSKPGTLKVLSDIMPSCRLFFVGVLLVGFGSSYYHWAPDNHTLVWDRLPMTIAFMALLSIVISEFVSVRSGKLLLLPLLLAGVLSVVYWHFTERSGAGDLRFYALVQFYPMIAIAIMLIFFRSRFSMAEAYWWLLLFYVIAKVFEHFDAEVYHAIGIISGHSLKHLFAAMGIYVLLMFYQARDINHPVGTATNPV